MAEHRSASTTTAVLIAVMAAGTLFAQDWPQWRGPRRDGAVTGFKEPSSWPEMLRQQWRVNVGLGYATPLVVGERLYMFTRQGAEEVMQAIDPASGKTIWRTGYAAPFTMNSAAAKHGEGPKSTPAFANGRLFTLGMSSIVTAFDAQTGRQVWQKAATSAQPMYHTAMSPLVDGDAMFVHVGGPNNTALTAFDTATGNVRWVWNGDSPAYGSPIIADLAGTRQIVTFTHQNLVGISAANGALLWKRPFITPSNTTAQTPIYYRDSIIQAGRENGIARFRVVKKGEAYETEDLWHIRDVSLQMSNAVEIDGVLYGLSHLNSGQYFALNLETGKVLWTSPGRQAENTAMLRAGNTIFSLENDAEMLILKAGAAAFEPVRRYPMADAETWAQPAISGDRFFVKDVSNLTLWTVN